MDIDDQNFQADANGVDARANYVEIASSSNGATETNPPATENDTKSATTLSELAANSLEQNASDSIVANDIEQRSTLQSEGVSELQNGLQQQQETNENINVNIEDTEEEQQNEQHIENAGIDPNYPLVLVQRVSIPPSGDDSAEGLGVSNNENAVAMDEDNDEIILEGRSPADVVNMLNAISAVSDNDDEEEEDDTEVEDVWSDGDDDEAAFLENPNFRGFSNQFEAIRNMIADTRRSMAEAEANFIPIPRNSLMQNFRRILFILNNRRRRLIHLGLTSPDVELQGGEGNVEMESANDANSENEDTETSAGTPPIDEANNMTIEQEEALNENAVRFDTSLPAEHSYMGNNMNRVSGVNYFEADQQVKLRIFLHQHVLYPGEILPFIVDSSSNIIEGDIDEENGILFGICFPCLSVTTLGNGDANDSASDDKERNLLYGVTCQIYELGEDNRSNTLIKCRALQRFVTKADDLPLPMEYINTNPRMKCFGFVKILPDIYLPDPLKSINMGSLNRFRDNTSMQDMYKRFQASTTPWPAHVYETHNISNIIERARTQLAQHKIDTMPNDPTQLSYWLVRNLHLPEEMLKPVFLANTVNTRLKLIASTFKKEAKFICRNCITHIADCRELFAMSKHGVQNQYCNDAGFIHETNTLYQVNRQNISYSGAPSTRFSWFPGYQWHIIVCKMCKHHLGWEFKAIEPNLVPKQFFGISSASVRVSLAQDRETIPAQNAVYINFLRLMNARINELRGVRNTMPQI